MSLLPTRPRSPEIAALPGMTWDEVTRTWPEVEKETTIIVTAPPRVRAQYAPGPWRVVAVAEAPTDESDLWQIVLAREYW